MVGGLGLAWFGLVWFGLVRFVCLFVRLFVFARLVDWFGWVVPLCVLLFRTV